MPRIGRAADPSRPRGSLVRAASDALARLAGITIGPTGILVQFGPAVHIDRAAELDALLGAVALLARDHGTALLVDEAQNIGLDAIGDHFHALQEVQGRTVTHRDPLTGALARDAFPRGAGGGWAP